MFVASADGQAARFIRQEPPDDDDVAWVVSRIEHRLTRVLDRWRATRTEDGDPCDEPLLAACAEVPPTELVRVLSPNEPKDRRPALKKPLCARSHGGLELHAEVTVAAHDRRGLERLCRYLWRPPSESSAFVRLDNEVMAVTFASELHEVRSTCGGATMSFAALWIRLMCRSRDKAQAYLRRRGRRTLWLGGLKAELDGEAHLPDGGFVAVYNETSWPDMFSQHALLWGTHIDRGAGAAEFAKLPFMKGASRITGVAIVPRGDRAGVDRALADLGESLQAGERVMFGGEGRMSGTDGVIRLKRGAALLAIRAQKPLVPLTFHGGHLRMPWRSLRLSPGKLHVRFGPPLLTEGLTEDDARDLVDRAQEE